MSVRRGVMLAEALAALALSGVLAAAAALSLGGARKAMLSAERRDRAQRAERETLAVLVQALRGDTAVDLNLTALLGVVCGVEPTALVVPPPNDLGQPALTAVAQPVDIDDVVSVLLPGGLGWWNTTVDSVTASSALTSCGSADGWSSVGDDSEPRIRLVLRDSIPLQIEPGMTVRVGRPGRFTLYHAGSGEWMLGWRRCSAISGVCGVVQPVAGPLRTPSAGGLRMTERASPARLELFVTGADGGASAQATLYR